MDAVSLFCYQRKPSPTSQHNRFTENLNKTTSVVFWTDSLLNCYHYNNILLHFPIIIPSFLAAHTLRGLASLGYTIKALFLNLMQRLGIVCVLTELLAGSSRAEQQQ